jgi:hypothetical protein
VDDAGAVRGGQRAGDLPRDHQRLAERQALQPRPQRLPVEELHHDVRAAVDVAAEVVDLDDPRALDRAGGARLVEESREHLLIRGQLRLQYFDGGAPAERGVLGEIDSAHPAAAQLLDDDVRAERLARPHRRTCVHPAALADVARFIPASLFASGSLAT